MSAQAFEKTNLDWQVQQLQQQVEEWLELKLSQFKPNLPDISLPSWLRDLTLPSWYPKAIFWIIAILLVTWLSWQIRQLWKHFFRSLPSLLRFLAQKPATRQVSQSKVSDWLRKSQEFYQQGNYREACRCLYKGMLQRLNDNGVAPHQPSRTDGEYLQLTQELPQGESYQTLLTTHERLCFGNAEISEQVFKHCQQAYQEIYGLEG
ncbi:MAG: hypothetical protein NVS2B14_13350 [Chamaesiphon sp.]